MRALLVRPARQEDELALAAIRATAAELVAGEPAAEGFPHQLDIPHGEDYFCLVAIEGSVVVGYVSAGGGRDPDRKSFAEIYEIAVSPRRRRHGVGHRLVAEAVRLLIEASYSGVTLWAPEGDEAVAALAAKSGLVPDGTHRRGEATGRLALRYARRA